MSTLDLEEAASLAKCGKEKMRQLAAAGEVPATRIGRRWVFSAQLLQQWIDQRCHSTGNPKVPSGGSALAATLARARAQRTASKQKNSNESSRIDSGDFANSETVVRFPGTRHQPGG